MDFSKELLFHKLHHATRIMPDLFCKRCIIVAVSYRLHQSRTNASLRIPCNLRSNFNTHAHFLGTAIEAHPFLANLAGGGGGIP